MVYTISKLIRLVSVHGVRLGDSISLPVVLGSISAAVRMAAVRAVCDFTWYEALTVRKQWQTADV
jgi:hypothetical protein